MPTIKRQSRSRQRSAGATARPLSAEACRNPSDERAFAENRRSDAHNRRTLRDGERHVVRHAHRQFRAVLGAGRARGENRVARAAQMRKAGRTLAEAARWVKENIPHFCLYATVDDLNHLYRGGRVSRTTAFLGSAIGIKPILKLDDTGNLVPIAKVRGRKQSIQALVKYMEEHAGAFLKQNDKVYITHGDCLEEAQYLAQLVKEKFGIAKAMINHIGPVIGSHAGPGALALSFMGESK